MVTSPQNVKLLRFLSTGNRLTARRARSQFNIKNLSARVFELRDSGYRIVSERVNINGTRTTSYQLLDSSSL